MSRRSERRDILRMRTPCLGPVSSASSRRRAFSSSKRLLTSRITAAMPMANPPSILDHLTDLSTQPFEISVDHGDRQLLAAAAALERRVATLTKRRSIKADNAVMANFPGVTFGIQAKKEGVVAVIGPQGR